MRRPTFNLSLSSFLVLFILLSSPSSSAQNVKRFSVGDQSAVKSISGIHIQQSVAQVYPIYSVKKDKTYYNPGFIQPGFKSYSIPSIPTHLTLYPNPTHGQFRLQSDRMMQQVRISITDINGREVFSQEAEQFEFIDINCTDWAKGLYLVSIIEYGLGTYTSKVIISE